MTKLDILRDRIIKHRVSNATLSKVMGLSSDWTAGVDRALHLILLEIEDLQQKKGKTMNDLDILRDRLVTVRNETTKHMLNEDIDTIQHYLSGLDRGLCLALRFIAEIKEAREKTQETS